jgi:hypothetical protein
VSVVPDVLRFAPFIGSDAVSGGLLTRGQLAGPAWRRLFRNVYLHAGTRPDTLTWCQAANLALPPGGVLSHRAAAFTYGVNLLPATRPVIDVTVPLSVRMRPEPGLVVHRARLPDGDVVRRGGLFVTGPGRTAFDLGRHTDRATGVVGLDALLHRRIIRPSDLVDISVGRAGWPGVLGFRAAAALARPGAESPMETRLRLCVVDGGLPEPRVQYEVFDADGLFVARLDLAYDEFRLGLEYDGDHHRERDRFQRDAVRGNRLRLCGWTVLRFTAPDVFRHPERLVAQVRGLLKRATSGTSP